LETGNTNYYWLSNRSNYVSARATQHIYNTLGIGDRFGFYIDGGHVHCGTLAAESPAIASFVSKFMLGQASANSDVEVTPFPTLDYDRWTAWWGDFPTQYPQFPNDWNSSGSVVMSLRPGLNGLLGDLFSDLELLGAPRINTGDTVQGGYQFAIHGNHPAATVSLTGGNVETDVRCFDGNSYTLTIPLPSNQSYSIDAQKSAWVPAPHTYQGSATATACPGGASQGVLEGAYFSALGLANGVGNPPAAPGLTTTDTTDPLDVRFGCAVNGVSTGPSAPLIVNFKP
jgi:hypothetical protein